MSHREVMLAIGRAQLAQARRLGIRSAEQRYDPSDLKELNPITHEENASIGKEPDKRPSS